MRTKAIVWTASVALTVCVWAGPAEDLEKTFDEACKAGEPLKADRTFVQLVAKKPATAPIRYYHAANVSRDLGKTIDRRTRLDHYLRVEKNWSETTEQAAWELCTQDNAADPFVLLTARSPASRTLFTAGIRLLDLYIKDQRAADFKKVAEAMLVAFKDEKNRESVIARIGSMIMSKAPGFTPDNARDFIDRYPVKNYACLEWPIRHGGEFFPPIWCLENMVKSGALMTDSTFGHAMRFDRKNAEECATAAKALNVIEKLCLDGTHHGFAFHWFSARIDLRAQYFKPGETNEMSAAYLALYDRAIGTGEKLNTIDLRGITHKVCQDCLLPGDRAKLVAKYPKNGDANVVLNFGGFAAACKQSKSVQPVLAYLQKNPDRSDVRWGYLTPLAEGGAFGEVKKAIETVLVENDSGQVDGMGIASAMRAAKVPDREKVDFLKAVYARTGAHPFWNWLKAEKNPNVAGASYMTNNYGKAFVTGISPTAKSNDRLIEIRREMYALKADKNAPPPEAAHKLYVAACNLFPGHFPQPNNPQNILFKQIQGRYVELCQNNPVSAPLCSAAVMGKLDPGNAQAWKDWFGVPGSNSPLRDKCSQAKDGFFNKLIITLAQRTGDANFILGLAFPQGTAKLPDGIDLAKATDQSGVIQFLGNNFNHGDAKQRRFTPEFGGSLICQWFARNDANKFDNNIFGGAFGMAYAVLATNKAALAQFPYDKVAADLLDNTDANPDFARSFLRFTTAAGYGEKYLKRYLNVLAKLDPVARFNLLLPLAAMEDVVTFKNDEKKTPELFMPLFRTGLLPAIKAIPRKLSPLVYFGSGNEDLSYRIQMMLDLQKDEVALKAETDAFADEFVRLRNAGATGLEADYGRRAFRYYYNVYSRALAVSNRVVMASTAHKLGRSMHPDAIGWPRTKSIFDDTLKAGFWEPLYLICNAVPGHNMNHDFFAEVTRLRGEASTHLLGVYPVTNKDPLYPLYVAADEFSRNNFERATALLMDKRNLPVFEREAIRLPPDFTAWAVEQLRLKRGAQDEILIKARAIANQLLENESKITPELAASMMLVRAECSRDQQNFEAAKLDYQTIRNTAAYQKTKAARKAMFRAVDLMIETGNASGAESMLEYWLSQPEPDVQAQAHYFLARIAFERKDYEETHKQLREVFAIDFTHTEGRFLEGKWKLATGNEIDDTQVMIGQLSDRTVIRPGQQLSICLQDRNLSVAGGGASIPVVVTTKPGGDRERIYLYPSVRAPSNFKGVILVKLGPVTCSNLVLDVTGKDTVSYSVDPDFLKARGLPLVESKRLAVMDDARLAIGVGTPKTDDGEDNPDKGSKVQKMLVTGDEGAGAQTPLRPGNPLYIAVMDKDRSFGVADGEVTVDVSTSSGDKLDNVPLRETAAFSGVFRGEIPSGLPPPRAYASDTAVGFNPCDVINSKRAGEWKSLADGGSGKWFAVDTMGSHEFSNLVFRMSAPEELRTIRLSGTLGDETTVLGLFPSGKPETRVGLRRQDSQNVAARGIVQLRAFYEKPDAPKVSVVTNLSFACPPPQHNWTRSVYFNGAFKMPSGFENLRFRLAPASTVGGTFKNANVSIHLDGICIFEGGGAQAVNAMVTTQELAPGVHRLEVFASGKTPDDSWTLLWEPLGEEARAIPAAWFDAAKHPEIVEFLADKADIRRTKDGFEAIFKRKMRLRSFRVEFLDRAGPGAQISGITATGWDGGKILPVERDFSDAQHNATLEVAPGDTISVRYADEKTSKGESRILTKTIGSSFTDAAVGFYFEDVRSVGMGRTISTLHRAYRFVPGDTLIVGVKDSDLDMTEGADTVKVTVRTKDGHEREISLVEQESRYGDEGAEGIHTGHFLGLLKTCPLSVTNDTKAIRCSNDEVLLLTYVDRENTRPGVPFVRTAHVNATRDFTPMITLFHSRAHKIEDRSREAAAKLEKIRRRAGNENVSNLYVDVVMAMPMERDVCNSTNDIPVNVAAPLPIRVNEPSHARHAASFLRVEAVAESERRRAAADGDEPQTVRTRLTLGGRFPDVALDKGGETAEDARMNGSFNGIIRFAVGGVDPSLETVWDDPELRPPIVSVSGSDRVFIRVLDENGDEILTRTVKLVANADMALMDSTWTAGRESVHVGEYFYVRVEDPDRDTTGEADRIEIDVATTGGITRKVILAESLPHSGVFSGVVQPTIFSPGELIPSVSTGATATAEQLLAESRIPVGFGESLLFRYRDEVVLPGSEPRTLCATGTVHKGADGDVRLFSKRFRDADMAILVQFRLAECLFEQAKDYRKLKQPEKSAEVIVKGRAILEEVLKNNPESAHVAQGEFLLANLYQELGSEAKQAGEKEKEKQLFAEALARFSSILAVWPEGEFGPRSQYHKAYCLEMLGDYKRAGEEYVKMTYIYPESDLVGDATIRLATHYYSHERMYATAARIYSSFAKRFPNHDKAPRALFMSGSCFVKEGERFEKEEDERQRKAAEKAKKEYQKQRGVYGPAAEMYKRAVTCFDDMAEKYRATTTPEIRAQALYWAGDSSLRAEDFKSAYLYLKRTILEYPETEWARRARGLLLHNGKAFSQIES